MKENDIANTRQFVVALPYFCGGEVYVSASNLWRRFDKICSRMG